MTQALKIPVELLDLIPLQTKVVETAPASALAIQKKIEQESYALFRRAVDEIKIIRREYLTCSANSWGKDSTVTLLAALLAHMELMREGVLNSDSPFLITNINTGVENHLIQMLSFCEAEKIKSFGKENGINVDLRIGTPPLAKQWAALFLSGIKIISSSRTNNDCSVILKVLNAENIERQIKVDYGEKVVTLLGVRLSESVSRASSVKRYGMDSTTANTLIERDESGDMVFAPIVNMSDDHIWTLIRQAGTNPISRSKQGYESIPSYANNHRLLNLIYSDSRDGSCPTSSKKIKGDNQTLGGCGASARTGCYLCAKTATDKSGEAQAKQLRHSIISGNIIKVRNYIISISQDIDYRTWHSRAFDATTGAITLQPNVLNAPALDKVIWLLSQATWDEHERAARFKTLVDQGRENEDLGFADILQDPALSPEDKHEMAEVYKKYATRPLIAPMSFELAIFLSAIHSRDGIRLPPYRALHVWLATKEGKRIPYPSVSVEDAKIDAIPDSVMVIPEHHDVSTFIPFTGNGLLDTESASGCDGESNLSIAEIPVYQAKHYLPKDELHKIDNMKPSDLVKINGLETNLFTQKLRATPTKHQPKKRYSKRSIVKASKRKGKYKVLDRGRTSLNSYSFGYRDKTSHLEERLYAPIKIGMPTTQREFNPLKESICEESTGYKISQLAIYDWIDYGGLEQALAEHDDSIRLHESFDDDIYYFGGVGVFESMLRWGLFKLGKSASENAGRMLTRTSYYNALGILALNDSAVRKLALNKCKTHKISEYRKNIKSNISLHIKQILPMKEYRSYKANLLLTIRNERNERRRQVRDKHQLLLKDPGAYALSEVTELHSHYKDQYKNCVRNWLLPDSLNQSGIKFFDGENLKNKASLNRGFLNFFHSIYTDLETMFMLFDRSVENTIKNDSQARQKVMKACSLLASELNDIEQTALTELKDDINSQNGQGILFYLTYSKPAHISSANEMIEQRLSQIFNSPKLKFKQTFKLSDCVANTGNIMW